MLILDIPAGNKELLSRYPPQKKCGHENELMYRTRFKEPNRKVCNIHDTWNRV